MSDQERRSALIRGLRDLAAFLEQHPSVPMPVGTSLNAFVYTREEMREIARVGTWEKAYYDEWMALRKMFGDDIQFDINIARGQVCERVVVGTQTVPAQPEKTVEIVEWRCADSLLGVSA